MVRLHLLDKKHSAQAEKIFVLKLMRFSANFTGVPREMRGCDVQLTGKAGFCIDTRTCISGYPELMGKRLRPVLPLLTKVHDCPDSTNVSNFLSLIVVDGSQFFWCVDRFKNNLHNSQDVEKK